MSALCPHFNRPATFEELNALLPEPITAYDEFTVWVPGRQHVVVAAKRDIGITLSSHNVASFSDGTTAWAAAALLRQHLDLIRKLLA